MTPSGGKVDYVKMDIEGAEREVLRDAESWAAYIRSGSRRTPSLHVG
ncbi:MAG: FkbM family methyltransferase [Actinobacteria bacterium]|nr:FkbM family methyltransferase [Actinomycetota bacterium]